MILGAQLDEFFLDVIFAEGLEIDQEHTGVDIIIRAKSQGQIGIAAKLCCILNELLRCCAQNVLAQGGAIQLGNISQNH